MAKRIHARGVRALATVGAIVVITFASAPREAAAAIESREILKTYFETGDIPTGEDFKDLIDSYVHQVDDGVTTYTLTGIGRSSAGGGPNGQGLRVGGNVGINELLPYADIHAGYTAADLPEMEPQWAGNYGYLPLRYSSDATGQTHYGYLQGRMESAGTPTLGPAFQAQYIAWETAPNVTIVTSVLPEPACAVALMALAGSLMIRSRGARV